MKKTFIAGLISLGPLLFAEDKLDPKHVEFFEKRIRPVLAQNCYECHSSATKAKGGLALDTRDALRTGGDSGEAIVPGRPEESLLIKAIRRGNPKLQMPPKTALSAEQIADLASWIALGAPDPRVGPPVGPGRKVFYTEADAKKHWAYQPIAKSVVPAANDPWVRTAVDAFILDKLRATKLTPAPAADKRLLLRRAHYDLIGLPPTMAETEAFLKDTAPNAFAKVIDRLLASPQYGERWGRYWLDIARYADNSGDRAGGNRADPAFPFAWTYRDYVINAFNADKPYNQFILEQIAADRLPNAHKEDLAALGFITVGKRFMNDANEVIDDRIDVVTKGLMGLSVSCARCHDHKFDPVPTADYYSLHGVFASSADDNAALADNTDTPEYREYVARKEQVQKDAHAYALKEYNTVLADLTKKADEYLLQAQRFLDGKTASKQPAAVAREASLNAAALEQWIASLGGWQKQSNNIFAPWFEFTQLPEKGFAAAAKTLAARVAANEKKQINLAVAKAFAGAAPQSLQEVAKIYLGIFVSIEKQMDGQYPTSYLLAAAGRSDAPQRRREIVKESMPPALVDADSEAIRKALFTTGTPLGLDAREVGRVVGNRVRNRQQTMLAAITQLDSSHPGSPLRAMALKDAAQPRDSRIFVRGERTNLGDRVPRQFLSLIEGDKRKPFSDGSGRLEMARAIVDPKNPLTARVLVNRVWQWHFGEGIVRTPSDFGLRSEAPTHPELLDWLATSFMDKGWSIKHLHRLIMTSSVYQQGAVNSAAFAEVDPSNKLLWKWPLRRLDLEATRDTLLVAGDNLDPAQHGRPVDLQSGSARRTVYGFINRAELPGMYQVFDFANPDMTSAERIETTVPQQALFLMNSPFVLVQARKLAARSTVQHGEKPQDKVRALYEILFQRAPTAKETEAALAFVAKQQPITPAPLPTVGPKPVGKAKGAKAKGLAPKGRTPAAIAAAAASQPLAPWEKLAQVLLQTNEFIHVQ